MSQDSLKRLLVLAVAGALFAAQPLLAKLGLNMDPTHAVAFATVIVGYLAQSGLKSALASASANKTLGTVFSDVGKAKAFFDQLKAAQALAAGKAATVAVPPAGSLGGPSQA